MNSDNIQADANLTQGSKINFGEQLKTARETMGILPQEAASRLNLSPRFIHMLENEDLLHSSLPPIYLRGYLRSYARILNIPERDINAVLEKLEPTPVILTTENVQADSLALPSPLEYLPSFSRLGTVVVSLILLTSITAWWFLHSNSSSPTVVSLSQPLNIQESNTENTTTPENNKENALAVPSLAAASVTTPAATEQQPSTTEPAANKLPTQPQLALAPTSKTPTAPTVAPHKVQEEGDENADEQE